MAIGDVIADVGAIGANLHFQPAAGVECIITWMGDNGSHSITKASTGIRAQFSYFTNGEGSSPAAGASVGLSSTKIFINNAVYLSLDANMGTRAQGYTGLQIK
ncbi:MAG: hypothetical protein ABGY11_05240 [Candidatus Thioglobus sp.]